MKNKIVAIPVIRKITITISPDIEIIVKVFILSLKNHKDIRTSKLNSNIFFGDNQEGFLFLSGEESGKYQGVEKELFKALCQSEILGPEAVSKLFQTAILETLDINSLRTGLSFEKRLDNAISNFKSAITIGYQSFCLYYPVFGLTADGLPFSLGNVEFGLFQEQYADELLLNPEKQPNEGKRKFVEQTIKNFHEMGFWGKTYVKIKAGAHDEITAKRNALREVRACLDILNFYSDLIPYTKGFLYLPGEASCITIITSIISIDDKSQGNISYNQIGPFDSISIQSLLKIEKEEGLGFTRVLQLMSGKRNEYEEKLLAALRWAGKATVLAYQGRKEDAFLHYTIALESIILPDRGNESTYRLSLRLAHLMATGAEYRPGIAKEVRDLYGVRSAIVHSGNFDVKDGQLSSLRFIVKNSLVHLLRDEPFSKISTQDELIRWFDERIFG